MKTFISSSVAIKRKSALQTLLTIALISFSAILPAQNTSILDNYLEEALQSNLALQQEDLGLQQQIEALRQAKGMFMPEVNFRSSYTLSKGGRSIAIPLGDLMNPLHGTLNQLTDSRAFPTNLENIEESLLPSDFHDTRVELRQPIFNTDIYYNYKAHQSMISVQQAKKATYEKELERQVKVGYYQYLSSIELISILDSTETLLKELVRVNLKLHENHKVTIDAVYRAELEVGELYSRMAEANRRRQLAKSNFNFLLNRRLDAEILVDPSLTQPENLSMDFDFYRRAALDQRDELDHIQYAIEAQNRVLSMRKGSKLPKVSVGAMGGYQGFGYQFDRKQDYTLVRFGLEVPLFAGFQNNSKIQQSKIELESLELQQDQLRKSIQVEVIDAYRNLQASQAEFDARQLALTSARKSFDIIQKKYLENMILLVDFLDARNKYSDAQLLSSIAKYDLLIKQAELERAASL